MSIGRLSATLLPLLLLVRPAPAQACGAMVFPDHGQRVGGMSDQELLVAFAAEETVLVASAGYAGVNAAEFAFLLPLASAPAEVRDADPAIFVALDEFSAPRVAVQVDDGSLGTIGFGCGAVDGSNSKDFGGGGEVKVHQRGTTATYEWVVVGGESGTAIATWLTDAGYVLPADYAAALESYVTKGWSFFAAKVLATGEDGALQPIEIHLPASEPEAFEIPLAIAAHSLSPGRPLGITTYLWTGGGPLLPQNYEAQAVDDDELVAISESATNYDALERSIIEGDPEGTWIIDASTEVLEGELAAAYEGGVEAGRVVPAAGSRAAIDDFFARLGETGGHLTRLRGELAAEQLRDLRLRRASGPLVDSAHVAVYDATTGCAVGRGHRLANLLWLLPVLAWVRPRRRVSGRR